MLAIVSNSMEWPSFPRRTSCRKRSEHTHISGSVSAHSGGHQPSTQRRLMHERTRGLFGERVMSTFSSKGAFQVTKPGILTSIDSGMTIRFIKVNGEPVRKSDLGIPSEWTTDGCEALDAISTAVAGLITQHLAIPHECLSLVWSRPQERQVLVTIVLNPLSEQDWEMLGSDSREQSVCQVCFQPCHDADDDNTRELNCVECYPAFLCDRCRVITRNGNPKCYLCLAPGDRSCLEEYHGNQMIRLRVLAPEVFA